MTTDTLECPFRDHVSHRRSCSGDDGHLRHYCWDCDALLIGNCGPDIYGPDGPTIDFQVTSLDNALHAHELGQLAIQAATRSRRDSRHPRTAEATAAFLAYRAAHYARQALNH